MIKNNFRQLLLTLLILLLTGCETPQTKNDDQDKRKCIVVTFSILEDMIKQVAGDKFKVISIVQRNSDPHVFTPKPSIVKIISQADLVVRNGMGFEGWLDRLITTNEIKVNVVTAATGIVPNYIVNKKDAKNIDPHAWHDVGNAIIYVRNITKALMAVDPANKDFYQQKGQAYTKKLEELDQWVKNRFQSEDKGVIRILNGHDAFYYYGKRYKIQFYPIKGISTNERPSAQRIARLIDLIKEKKIQAIFTEHNLNTKIIKQIAHATNKKVGGMLYSDSLSYKDEANTYIKMIKYNTDTIIAALK